PRPHRRRDPGLSGGQPVPLLRVRGAAAGHPGLPGLQETGMRRDDMEGKTYQSVGQPVRKKDAMALLLGKPAYVDDVTPRDCLVVKVLRSPHAHALIEEIDTSAAMKVPGIAAIFTYRDVPQKRFTMAGQTYPEPSPYDRLILDQRVRFV